MDDTLASEVAQARRDLTPGQAELNEMEELAVNVVAALRFCGLGDKRVLRVLGDRDELTETFADLNQDKSADHRKASDTLIEAAMYSDRALKTVRQFVKERLRGKDQ